MYIKNAEEAFQRAKWLLKENYGQPYQINSTFIDKLFNGPILNIGSTNKLTTLAVDLEICLTTLTGFDCVNDIQNQLILIQILIDCQQDYDKNGVQSPVPLWMKSTGQFLLLTLPILCLSKHVKLISQFLDWPPNVHVKWPGKNFSLLRQKLARNLSIRCVYFVLRRITLVNLRVFEVFHT